MKVLGKGTYNTVFLDNNVAVRVAKIDDNLDMLKRSQNVVKLINSLEITPSIFRIIEDGKIYESLPPIFGLPKGTYYVQKIEYFAYPFNEMTMDYLFFLIWFLCATSSELGFIHKDLKPNNILLRQYNPPKTFKFKLGERTFKFKMSKIPVVMDFDLSSTIKSEARQVVIGTTDFAPPETILRFLCKMPNERNDFSYDWWSLGMTIFYSFVAEEDFDFVDQEILDRYKKYNLQNFTNYSMGKSLVLGVLKFTLIKNALSGETMGPNYQEVFSGFYTPENITFLRVMVGQSKPLKEAVEKKIPKEYRVFLNYLLSWIPEQRNLEGDPWRFLELFYPSQKDDFEADFEYER